MDNLSYKKKYKPSACTRAPWEYLIPFEVRKEVMRQINQECMDIYGYSYEECPKRMICIGKSCIGRPLPWDSPTARPYLEKLAETQTIENEELFIQTDCSSCPLFTTCKSPCFQIDDFLQRDRVQEPQLHYQAKTSTLDHLSENIPLELSKSSESEALFGTGDIPWDCLPTQKQQIIKKYLYEQLDFKYIAEQLGVNNQARCKKEFYYGLTKLSEFAIMRKFIEEEGSNLTEQQKILLKKTYIENKTYKEIAKELEVSAQNVQQVVSRVIKKYNIKWPVFVYTKGNKIYYNVPEVFK